MQETGRADPLPGIIVPTIRGNLIIAGGWLPALPAAHPSTMPIERIDEEGHIRLAVSGQVTNGDLGACLEEVLRQPGFVPGTPVLMIDETGAYKGSAGETRAAASMLEGLQADGLGKLAVVVSHTLQFGIGRELEAHSETRHVRFRVFRSEKAALQWLSDPLPDPF